MSSLNSRKINSPQEAVALAKSLVGTGIYWLGTGDCDTPVGGKSDCAGFAISRCYNLRRHRPGFNRGHWASIEDDLNCNSAIEDAHHKQELFVPVYPPGDDVPRPGDLLTYPTFYLKGHPKPWIGHIAIVTEVPAEWAWGMSRWASLGVVQCAGPDGRTPGIVHTNAAHWDDHDKMWPKPEHRSVLIRVKGEAKQ